MAIYKRGDTYHADVTVNGTRYRQSLETGNWQEAQRKQKDLIGSILEGKAAGPVGKGSFAALALKDALEQFIRERVGRISDNTTRIDRERGKVLNRILGDTLVRKIDAATIRTYQDKRGAEVSPRTINLEVTLIRQILKKAKRWSVIADDVSNLPENRNVVGRVLTREQKILLFRTAASKPEWETAYLAAVIAASTTCRKVELLTAHWADVDLFAHVLNIHRSKTQAGHRSIPLNSEALAAFARLRRRAEAMGGGAADEFVFPACEHGHFDSTRPMKSFRTAWRSLVKATSKAAGDLAAQETPAARKVAAAPFKGFRFHDLRHQAVTELSEAGVSDAALMAIAGHMSRKMLEHYSHVRMAAKRQAIATLDGGLIAPELGAEDAAGKAN